MERKYYVGYSSDDRDDFKLKLNQLKEENIDSVEKLEEFLAKFSELCAIISEEGAWKYIDMTRFADKKEYSDAYNIFYSEVGAVLSEEAFEINNKIYSNKFFNELPKYYDNYKKILKNDIDMFCKENTPLKIEDSKLGNKYGEIFSQLKTTVQGKEYTVGQAGKFLRNENREIREEAWKNIFKTIINASTELNELFDELVKIRHNIATNKGYKNFRDYKHEALGRFSYKPEDIYKMHEAVEKEVLPFVKELNKKKAEKLNLKSLKPWDNLAPVGGKPLVPFKTIEEFINKGIATMTEIKPEFGKRLQYMKDNNFLDLEIREGKAPGGYNYPLEESGVPFIFMNANGVNTDVTTLLHEAGHAMHSFATKDIVLSDYNNAPSEVAELASMAMEFITVDSLDNFYPNELDFKNAKKEQLEGALEGLPWIMTIDAFQQWVYTNPTHTKEEREAKFAELRARFNTGIDTSNERKEEENTWLRQLHIFEVPFYYIEYGISQLGAIAIYKNYKENPEKTLEEYENFLKLGYSKSVEEIYETAGIKFDFSSEYIKELVDFISEELKSLEN